MSHLLSHIFCWQLQSLHEGFEKDLVVCCLVYNVGV